MVSKRSLSSFVALTMLLVLLSPSYSAASTRSGWSKSKGSNVSRVYYSKGKVTQREKYDSRGKLDWRKYYKSGNVTKYQDWKSGKIARVDTFNGKNKKTTYYNSSKKRSKVVTYKNGKRTAQYTYYSSGKVKTKNTYFSNGKLSTEQRYDTRGKLTLNYKYDSKGYNRTLAKDIYNQINREREKRGLKKLKYDSKLYTCSDRDAYLYWKTGEPHSIDCNVSKMTYGENAIWSSSRLTPRDYVGAWTASPGHAKTQYSTKYNRIAVSVYVRDGQYFIEAFYAK